MHTAAVTEPRFLVGPGTVVLTWNVSSNGGAYRPVSHRVRLEQVPKHDLQRLGNAILGELNRRYDYQASLDEEQDGLPFA